MTTVAVSAPAAAGFRQAHPEFDATAVAALRSREYARLDEDHHAYLDYTGGGLHARSQLSEHLALLAGSVLGNPHSTSPASSTATSYAERARAAILAWCNASPDEYTVVFTANASAACKLVGEAYPFAPHGRLLLSADDHNSVNGIREFARARGADVRYLPLVRPDLRLDDEVVRHHLADVRSARPGLFAYPAQSNYSGVRHPLTWIDHAHEHGWDVLLDAAAYLPTNRLDLGRWHPDFVTVSWYKVLGYPTGIGSLIARREALARLQRPWFAGGTIGLVSVAVPRHTLAPGETGFEDGTIDYLGLPAIEMGLRHISSVGIDAIGQRVRCLTDWLLARLQTLVHRDGSPLIRLYGPTTTQDRGGTVPFNVLDRAGRPVDFRLVEARAGAQRVSVRTGCFCNPGASEAARGITAADLAPLFDMAVQPTLDEMRQLLPGRALGAVRASMGIASDQRDIDRLVDVLESFRDEPPASG